MLEHLLDRDRPASDDTATPSARASQARVSELRQREREALLLAAEAALPHVRAAHERAAAKWRELADRRERRLGEDS
ncbi:hypothetical protein [Phenylobacterium sp.]|uniref:hypothetical protein n=1 Tax=Phenylobacterium sp. TaxID=1871053 RepID=UPI002B790C63|nr:hypothetical protein [Phenylobacterium sp.]HVI32507.1 hypothetical protein [Phenylobacterium sp.]